MSIAQVILAQREGYGQELFYIIAILILSVGSAIFQKVRQKFEEPDEGRKPEPEKRIEMIDERPPQRRASPAPPVRPARPAAPMTREQPRRPPVRPMPPVRERPPSRQPAPPPARPARDVGRMPPIEPRRTPAPRPAAPVPRPRPAQPARPAAPARSAAAEVEFVGEPLRDTMQRRDDVRAAGLPAAVERAKPVSVSLGDMSMDDLRRAIVLKEILDPPVALRGDSA
jgi:hypothetical protein